MLPENGYFIDNDIFLTYSDPIPGDVLHYTLRITNENTGVNSGNIRLYPPAGGQELLVNIAPVIKALFQDIGTSGGYTNVSTVSTGVRGVYSIRLSYLYRTLSGEEIGVMLPLITRVFLRGGKPGNHYNIFATPGQVLRATETLPYWPGYFTAEYTVTEDYLIRKNPLMEDVENKEMRRFKGCNPVYLSFKNSLAAWSYWLFEGQTTRTQTTHQGYSIPAQGEVRDYGSTENRTMVLYSKVPARFYPLIEDLVKSPSVRMQEDGQPWPQTQVIVSGNSVEFNPQKKNYEVKINVTIPSNYNPSILWQ